MKNTLITIGIAFIAAVTLFGKIELTDGLSFGNKYAPWCVETAMVDGKKFVIVRSEHGISVTKWGE